MVDQFVVGGDGRGAPGGVRWRVKERGWSGHVLHANTAQTKAERCAGYATQHSSSSGATTRSGLLDDHD